MSCDCDCGDFPVISPSSIAKCFQDDDGNAIDVFDMAIPEGNPYREDLKAACWARWRYAPISSLCVSRWIQRLTDRCALMDRRYQLIIAEYEKQKAELASLGYGWTETYKDVTTPTGTDIRTVSGSDSSTVGEGKSSRTGTDTTTAEASTSSKSGTDTTTNGGEDKTVKTHEDLPPFAYDATTHYYTAQDVDTVMLGSTATVEHSESSTDTPGKVTVEHAEDSTESARTTSGNRSETVTDKPGVVTTVSGTHEHTEQGGRTADAFRQMMDELEDPYVRYAGELKDMFLDYWALEGRGCC